MVAVYMGKVMEIVQDIYQKESGEILNVLTGWRIVLVPETGGLKWLTD